MSTDSRVLRNPNDGWANEARETQNYAETNGLGLSNAAGARAQTFMYFNRPFPIGATIVSATLRLHTKGAWGISTTLSVRRTTALPRIARLTWKRRPDVTGPTASLTRTSGTDGDEWAIDIADLMQDVADGAPWYGLRITTAATVLKKLYSADAAKEAFRPTLEIEWGEQPQPPAGLSPAGGKSVSLAKPKLRFKFIDRLGSTALAAVRVQLDATGDFAGGDLFDSGWVDSGVPSLDLATTAYAGLADGATTSWRAFVRDAAGLESAASDVETFRRDTKAALDILNPGGAPNDFVTEWTPEIIWSFAGVQTAFRVIVTPADDATIELHNSGRIPGNDNGYTIPKGVLTQTGDDYRVEVRVFDDKDRATTPLDPPYIAAERIFHFSEDATVAPVSSITATALTPRPSMALDVTRATAPDSFTLLRDGEVIESGIDPADVIVSAGLWRILDRYAPPRGTHEWSVQCVVNRKTSKNNPTVTGEAHASGAWLVDPELDLEVFITGKQPVTFRANETTVVNEILGSDEVSIKNQRLGGLAGDCSGRLASVLGVTAAQWRDRLVRIRKRGPAARLILITGDKAIPVRIWDVVAAPGSDVPGMKAASFQFTQVR